MSLKQRRTAPKLIYERLLQQFHAMAHGQVEEFMTEFGERHLLGKFESDAGLCMMLKPNLKGAKGIVLDVSQPENMAADAALLPYRLRDYFGFILSEQNILRSGWKKRPCYCVVARAIGTVEICSASLPAAKEAVAELSRENFFWQEMYVEDVFPCDPS